MNDTGWRRNKYGGLFNINDNKEININNYMNDKIRSKAKKIAKKDVVNGDIYRGADGYWNYDLKEGILSDFGLPYIWNKTKSGANLELKMLIRRENILNEREKNI